MTTAKARALSYQRCVACDHRLEQTSRVIEESFLEDGKTLVETYRCLTCGLEHEVRKPCGKDRRKDRQRRL